jgi:glutathione gamma-glutamylcysteinyltransferase
MDISVGNKSDLLERFSHSPIGAFNDQQNLALVLDTARFKYPSYYAHVDKLFEAMKPIDRETGLPRGYFLLAANPHQPPFTLCDISVAASDTNEQATVNWITLAKIFCKDIPERLHVEKPNTIQKVVEIVLSRIPKEYSIWVCLQQADRVGDLDILIQAISKSPLYLIVADAFPASPPTLFATLPRDLSQNLAKYRDLTALSNIVKNEVHRMSDSIGVLLSNFCTCGATTGNISGACST